MEWIRSADPKGGTDLYLCGEATPKSGAAHKLVWDRFQSARPPCQDLGAIGVRLKRRREMADDEETFADVDKAAEAAILDAEEFFKLLKQRPNCP